MDSSTVYLRLSMIFAGLVLVSGAHASVESIVVNQVGYLESADKSGYIISRSDESLPPVALRSLSGEPGLASLPIKAMPKLVDGRHVSLVDFSKVEHPGWYQLESGHISSVPFAIGSDNYRDLNQRLVHALYLQRSGTEVREAVTGMMRPPSHMNDGVIYRSDAFNKSGSRQDTTGGWYDAGDFGKYVATTTVTVARLLEAYRQSPALFSGYHYRGSQLPAVLDESIYALEWLRKMQRGDGAVYRKVSGAQWPAKIAPWQDLQPRYIYGVSTPETAKFAATMAFAARVIKPFNHDLSRQYLSSAIHAANYLSQHPEQYIDWQPGDDSGSGPYVKNKHDMEPSLETDVDDRLWAYAELYLTTGQDKYLQQFEKLYQSDLLEIFEWKNPALMGVWHLIEAVDSPFTAQLVTDLDSVAERYHQQALQSPFYVANQRFIWGSNKMTAEAGILMAWADLATGKVERRQSVQSQMDYVLGANPFNMSYVTASGTYAVKNLHHLYQIATGVSLPGFMVGGPNEKAQAGVAPKNLGMLSYIDSDRSYAVNEFAIDYNASLIGLIAVHQAYFNRR